ncbi:elongation of very long chain fatty acids protein AAEL008004-like [Toxorhynchites rutilus septentrionalis]|uniref:elongation of very long chain fatty acids protein AAEL008004-like n=1 Tax=Toxorhynchites rutilus septentrionalis TaxID=329112 RepID=UPI00247A8BD5|nr:elongation of very long chain fatty acids protein AAEL008004-like [Toxorhynchites rutilus septentrionalis]
MADVLHKIYDGFDQFIQEHRDVRSRDFPLIDSSWQVPAIVGMYLWVVLQFGPRFMENRKPYDLKKFIRAYNIVQIVANSAFFLIEIYLLAQRPNFSYSCQPVDFSTTQAAYEELYMSYAYFLLKVLDMADTLFFVLRKKQSHVSFLHVYHHAIMVAMTYIGVLFVPGGHIFLLGLWNTLVHAVMYFYYYLSSFGSEWAARFKKYLTRMQLVQFIHLGIHFGRPALLGTDCGFPKLWHWIGFGQAIFICAMFVDFYIKSYVRKQKKHS